MYNADTGYIILIHFWCFGHYELPVIDSVGLLGCVSTSYRPCTVALLLYGLSCFAVIMLCEIIY